MARRMCRTFSGTLTAGPSSSDGGAGYWSSTPDARRLLCGWRRAVGRMQAGDRQRAHMEAAGHRHHSCRRSANAARSPPGWTPSRDSASTSNGREAQFVDNTCNAAPPDVMALRICQETKAAVSDQRRIP
jgi:hypothetical protein